MIAAPANDVRLESWDNRARCSRGRFCLRTLETVRLRLSLRVLGPNSIRLLDRLVLGWGAAPWGSSR